MNDTFLRYFSSLHFLWLVPNFRFIMITFTPFFGIFAYFIGSSSILTIRVHSNIHCDFSRGTTTGRPNRWRTMSFPPLHP
ncbi:hypothetical protein P692DRAFT_20768780, partial [Suillus brevipes Sb2]